MRSRFSRFSAVRAILRVCAVSFFAVTLSAIPGAAYSAGGNPRERIDFWVQNYGELKPEDDPRAARAAEVFRTVLNAAGRRPGVVPRLFITRKDPYGTPTAIALPDGWIVLSKGALDICYRNPGMSDGRLAFVLAHEIAHQLKNDFWHVMFFSAIEISEEKSSGEAGLLREVREIAGSTEKVLAKELQADEHGIVYAAMAGFDTGAIVAEKDGVNFFEEWVRALDPARVEGLKRDERHPAPEERAETVKARLRQVQEKTGLFSTGVLLYQANRFEEAALFFEEFLRYFPSREVYHNLAACHHQLALANYKRAKEDESLSKTEGFSGAGPVFPFKLTIVMDPVTRASGIRLRGTGAGETPGRLYRIHLERAIELYQAAIEQDPAYLPSYMNLGCAYILAEDFYKAIAIMKDALKLEPKNARVSNNLGVAFYYAENPKKAYEEFARAHELDPSYADPLFNLGRLSSETEDGEKAARWWNEYLALDPVGPWADAARSAIGTGPGGPAKPDDAGGTATAGKLAENPGDQTSDAREALGGVEAGYYEDEVPAEWSRISSKSYSLKEYPFIVNTYGNGVLTISQDDRILVAAAGEGYAGTSALGIKAGSPESDVISRYGVPSGETVTAQGNGLFYLQTGISFMIRGGKVDSWVVYEPGRGR